MQGKKVVGMLQNDMTGYVGKNKEVIGIVTDHVDDKVSTKRKKKKNRNNSFFMYLCKLYS